MDDRFLELYDRYCDGALTPAVQEELVSLLGDPVWRSRFVELAILEAEVTEELRLRRLGAGADDDAMPACPVEPERPASRRRLPAAGVPERRPWLWIGLAAAGVLALVLPALLKADRAVKQVAPSAAREAVVVVPGPVGPAESPLPATGDGKAVVAVAPPAEPARAGAVPTAEPAAVPVPEPGTVAAVPEAAEPSPAVESPPPQPWQRPNKGRRPQAGSARTPAPVAQAAPAPRATETAVAVVTEARGKVQIVGARGGPRQPARDDQSLLEGQGLHVAGPNGSAVLEYADGTLLELGPETLVTRVSGGEGAGRSGDLGKSAFLERGALGVVASPQPVGRPLILATPHAEIRVLGTQLTLTVGGDATRLGVHEGEVQVTRLADEATLKVGAGHFAVVTDGGPLLASPLRTRAGLVALYPFDEGQGTVVRDVSGVGAPLPLRIASPEAVGWVPGGLAVHGPAGIVTFGPAEKIISACKASGELTLEAWVRPAASGREGYLLAISSNPLNVNVALDLGGAPPAWGVHLTAERTGEGGAALAARRGPVAGTLRHVVYAHAADGQGILYVDGAPVATHRLPGGFARWDANHRLALAADPRGNRPWTGELRLVAVFSRALTASEVRQHYLAGPD